MIQDGEGAGRLVPGGHPRRRPPELDWQPRGGLGGGQPARQVVRRTSRWAAAIVAAQGGGQPASAATRAAALPAHAEDCRLAFRRIDNVGARPHRRGRVEKASDAIAAEADPERSLRVPVSGQWPPATAAADRSTAPPRRNDARLLDRGPGRFRTDPALPAHGEPRRGDVDSSACLGSFPRPTSRHRGKPDTPRRRASGATRTTPCGRPGRSAQSPRTSRWDGLREEIRPGCGRPNRLLGRRPGTTRSSPCGRPRAGDRGVRRLPDEVAAGTVPARAFSPA